MAIQTHYDTLQVARNASSDVIRAAYKNLTLKFNAEPNPGAAATEAMKGVHESYAVLSNPIKRAEYDRWLLERESAEVGKRPEAEQASVEGGKTRRGLFLILGAVILAVAGWLVFSGERHEPQPDLAAETSAPPIETGPSAPLPVETPAIDALDAEVALNAPNPLLDSIPEHDPVAIREFTGIWKGRNGKVLQSLDISAKSDNSLVFRLEAQAGPNTGEVYGIADYANGMAQFYNKEYDCNMLFTVKAGTLRLDSSSCQEYHETGITFDGSYSKPEAVKASQKPAPVIKPKPVKTEPVAVTEPPPPPPEAAPVVAANLPKLRKFSVTVKDAEGNVSTIELLAKDKNAAKNIIRDYRGNPTVMKIKEVKR